MSGPRCIVCGKPIAKKTHTIYLRETNSNRSHGEYSDETYSKHLFLDKDKWPKNKADCQKLTNMIVVSVQYTGSERSIYSFGVWDGQSYDDEFFHSQLCATRQGYAAAREGLRWTWK